MRLVEADSGKFLIQVGGSNDLRMRHLIRDFSKWKRRKVGFQIVDQKTTGWAHLNVDDISVQSTEVDPHR